MRLNIKELAYIKSAEIRLDGITCIAGENNVGKSTIGKILFSVIYGMNQYQQIFEEDRIEFIEDKLRILKMRLNQSDSIHELISNIRVYLHRQEYDEVQILTSELEKEVLKENLIQDSDLERVLKVIHQIQKIISQDVESNDVKKRMLNEIINRIFEGQISSLHTNQPTSIQFMNKQHELLNLILEDNELTKLTSNQEIPFDQIIYIESPYVFQFMNIYQTTQRVGSRVFRRAHFSQIPLYIRDLLQKMIIPHSNVNSIAQSILNSEEPRKQDINLSLEKIIGGEMLFDKKDEQFIFSAHHIKQPIKMANVASGIKSLSIIQRLLSNGWLNELSVLVIDEPENHLHPKWQIEFAKFLVNLYVEHGIKIVITSHSPYFIETLDVYTKKLNVQKQTAFYLAEGQEDGTIMKDVSNHLEVIFELLSEPLDILEEERL